MSARAGAAASWAGLHVIADDPSPEGVLAIAEASLEGGARIVQVRMKGTPSRTLFLAASAVAAAVRCVPGARVVVNDRLDVALAAGADAVHLGRDLPRGRAGRHRAAGPPLWGLSTHDPGQALAAEQAGAAYIGFGPVFATGSKADALPPRGIAQLRAVCRAARVPVIAIGGITPGNAARAISAGAAGIAVISAVAGAPDRVAAVRELVSLFEENPPPAKRAGCPDLNDTPVLQRGVAPL
jgi:thiamine-phosphate diphosphorylase